MRSLPASLASLSNLIFIFVLHGVLVSTQDVIANIGAIIDVNSRTGKEEKISMEVAIQEFNTLSSIKHTLILHTSNSVGDPLQASTAADMLIKEKQVEVIIGMETWKEAGVVTEVANRAQVPVLSFAAPSINSQLTSLRWPFLVKMAGNDSAHIHCVASIVGFYGWQRVIAIYEDDGYYTDSGMITLLSDALRVVGSEVEYWSAFPPLSSLSDTRGFLRGELEKVLNTKQSRVFIILRSSLELVAHVLAEANHIGLMGKDSVWIATDSVTSLLDTVNSSVMSSMHGLIGVKTHFSENSKSFLRFSTKFRNLFRSVYPEEDKTEPGIHALRAYDAISTVALALEKSCSTRNSCRNKPRMLVENILSSNFNGLSGKIQFENEELSGSVAYEIINVVGKSYTVRKFWSPDYGFSDKMIDERSGQEWINTIDVVYWPGGLDRVPLGWKMPSDANQMVIGVPGSAPFEEFVKVVDGEDPTGFSIDVFNRALRLLNYDLPHKFEPFSGLYDDLVHQVYLKLSDEKLVKLVAWVQNHSLKNFDAVVGDITILENRSNYVEFTQPYAESGMTMVVPAKSQERDWMFVKPFTPAMWAALGIVFAYTMFVVWFLEHRSNPDFRGPWKNQLSTTTWFIFSTFFFAHKETLRSNFTRVVMVVWLFVVFVITSSYTASLTSILTVQRLEPTVTDIETLRRSNSPIGSGRGFTRKYLEQVLGFHPNNIINVKTGYDYQEAFKSGRIKAAFLELPYERIFISKYCKDFQVAGPTYRLGGLGFVFPKGSPMAKDFSKAFLRLSEDGTLNNLDKYWFTSPSECSNKDNVMNKQSLGLSNFWSLFLVTGLTSTIMLILYIVHLYMKFRRHNSVPYETSMDCSSWNRIKKLGTYLLKGAPHLPQGDTTADHSRDAQIMISSNGDYFGEYNTPGSPPLSEIEMPATYTSNLCAQTRMLKVANSFPALNRHTLNDSSQDHKWRFIPNST